MISIYLDSNILIAYYSLHRSEQAKKQMVRNAVDVFARAKDVWLCTSVWAVTEMVIILISSMKMAASEVAEIERRLVMESFSSLKLHILDVSPEKSYHFADFFQDIRLAILKYHSGVGDIIHSVIMKNNGIDHILTFDEKDDFKKIPGLTVFHPRDISLP
jgi:predicted nucleic acid-binding protein